MVGFLLVGEMGLTAFLAFVIVYSVLYPNLWPVKGRFVKQAVWRGKPWLLDEEKGLCEFEGKELIDGGVDKPVPFVLKTFDGVEFKRNFTSKDLQLLGWHNVSGQAPQIYITPGTKALIIGDAEKELTSRIEELSVKLSQANNDSNDWRLKYEDLNSNFDNKMQAWTDRQIALSNANKQKVSFKR